MARARYIKGLKDQKDEKYRGLKRRKVPWLKKKTYLYARRAEHRER